jgi:pimeloyl-ACP methyl ester carboxylesterase
MTSIETRDHSLRYDDDPDRVIRVRVSRTTDAPNEDAPRPAVIVVHGFKGFLLWGFFPELQRRIVECGWISVAVNLSGSGVGEDLESFTEDDAFFRSTTSRDVEDLERVRAFVESRDLGIDASRLALFGHSRGGGSALLHAERARDYRAVVTWASISTTDRFGDDVKAVWRKQGLMEVPNARTRQTHRVSVDWLDDVEANASALDIRAACSRSSTPTLLVHATGDASVPYAEALALEEAFEGDVGRLLTIEGSGHTLGAVHPFRGTTPELEQALEETLGFLRAKLG